MDSTIPQLHIRRGEANTAYVMAWVESLGPDVIVSHGPERLRGEFIGLAKRGGVNVHWGLSPTYRGMDTTRWPLIHGEPEWIGVTIHRLDPGLDTGPILYQAKPDLVAGDTYRQIEYRLTNLACEIVPVAVREIMDGSERPIHQDLTLGRQYWADEWTHRHQQMLTKDYIVEQIEAYHADKNARDHATPLINPWSER
jgi:methionyl-tRNA formyltransferase